MPTAPPKPTVKLGACAAFLVTGRPRCASKLFHYAIGALKPINDLLIETGSLDEKNSRRKRNRYFFLGRYELVILLLAFKAF